MANAGIRWCQRSWPRGSADGILNTLWVCLIIRIFWKSQEGSEEVLAMFYFTVAVEIHTLASLCLNFSAWFFFKGSLSPPSPPPGFDNRMGPPRSRGDCPSETVALPPLLSPLPQRLARPHPWNFPLGFTFLHPFEESALLEKRSSEHDFPNTHTAWEQPSTVDVNHSMALNSWLFFSSTGNHQPEMYRIHSKI